MSEFDKKAKQLLDEHADSLDGATRSRLHQIRSSALEEKHFRFPATAWAGVGTVAAGLVVAVVFYNPPTPHLPTIYEDPLQQAAAEELELIDDLDFYAWMVLQDDAADGA